MEKVGLEPTAFRLQGGRSAQMSYIPERMTTIAEGTVSVAGVLFRRPKPPANIIFLAAAAAPGDHSLPALSPAQPPTSRDT